MPFVNLNDLPAPPRGKKGWPWTEESGEHRHSDGFCYPRISIVTPSYNQGKFLEQTIRSVLLQNYPNLEYIIIDGGSSDDSVEIIKKYENYLTYWVSEPDNGQSNAINKGFLTSTADIMAWLNSDDYYAKGAFHLVATQLHPASETYALVGHCQTVFTNRAETKLSKGYFESVTRLLEFWKGYTMPQSSIFWRKEVFEKVGLLNEDYHYIMDFDYWLRIAQHFGFKNIDKVLSFATYHSEAKTGDNYQTYHKELRNNAKKYWKSIPGVDYSSLSTSLSSYDQYKTQVFQAIEDIVKIIPSGSSFILADSDQWETNDFVEGRRRFHFPEKNGVYNGLPADDTTALEELQRMMQQGVKFFVLASSSFWFLEHYYKLKEYLQMYSKCLFKNSEVMVFHLS